MKFHISSIEGNYATELKRLFVFSHLCLPLFSFLSMLTGGYFLASKILPGILPSFSYVLWFFLAFVMVSFLEAIKYFVSPLMTKSLWHKDYLMTLILTPLVVGLFGTSIYFSVQGVQEFYLQQDTSSEEIKSQYRAQKDSIEQHYKLRLAEKDSSLATLEGKLGNQNILSRLDKINRRIRTLTQKLPQTTNDSLKGIYQASIQDLRAEKRMVESSTGNSAFQINKMNILVSERNTLQEERVDRLEELKEERGLALQHQHAESHFVQANILYLSLGIEILIALSLSYIQYYRLRSGKTNDTKEADEIEENDTGEVTQLPNDTRVTLEEVVNDTEAFFLPEAEKPPLNGKHTQGQKAESGDPISSTRKRLSEADKEMIIRRFSSHEGNVEELVQEIIHTYGISRRTVYRYKQKAEQNGLKRLP
ncbi:MAG: hypothetical protein AAF388_20955 [Bacteroidota bacterium]